MTLRFYKVVLTILFTIPMVGLSQGLPPIGEWRDHLSYRKVFRVAAAQQQIFAATRSGFFSVNTRDLSIERYSKSSGLSNVGLVAISADSVSGHLLVAYSNGDLDFVTGNDVCNINAIRLKSVPGSKAINSIAFGNSRFYVATDFGIVVIDAQNGDLLNTYVIGRTGNFSRVYSVSTTSGALYAATVDGLLSAPLTGSNIADFRSWQLVSGSALFVDAVTTLSNQIFVARSDSVFRLLNDQPQFVFSNGSPIFDFSAGDGLLALTGSSRVVLLTSAGVVSSVLSLTAGRNGVGQSLPVAGEVWLADSISGLSRVSTGNVQTIIPDGPSGDVLGKIYAAPGVVLAASASNIPGDTSSARADGFYKFSGGVWQNFNRFNVPALDSLPFISSVAMTPAAMTYAGSIGGGLAEFGDRPKVYKQGSFVGVSVAAPGKYNVTDLTVDGAGNLWIANDGATKELGVKTFSGATFNFGYPFPIARNAAGQLVSDDFNQIWMQVPGALLCFNYGSTIDNTADDHWYRYSTGSGNGNLPSSDVHSLLKDRNGFIWVGTDKGIGIIQCPQQVFSGGCPAIQPVVQQDNFAGYLFQNETVQCMQVDGANRKWIGTKNGAWLISEGGEKVVFRFTAENSPLLSNDVRNIGIEPITGEVFFGTAGGLCSFRSTATDASADTVAQRVLVFPNPVPPGYTGTIGIRGLPENAQVKITEMDGRIVFQTRALGGQAVWNGTDSHGRRATTGVYLVLVSDAPATKIVFIKGK